MLENGTIVDGKYKILDKIGQGGMSVVYLAMNEKVNKQWAIKEVRKEVAEISLAIAEQVIRKELSSDASQKELANKLLDEIENTQNE